jgi:hypothetical protein
VDTVSVLPPQPKTVTMLEAMISDEAGSEGRMSQLLTLNGLCGCRPGPRHPERAADWAMTGIWRFLKWISYRRWPVGVPLDPRSLRHRFKTHEDFCFHAKAEVMTTYGSTEMRTRAEDFGDTQAATA